MFDHILVPHWPYVFDEDGQFDDSNVRVADIKRPLAAVSPRTRDRYVRQVEFSNRRTLRLIDSLLAVVIWKRLSPRLKTAKLHRVRVYESDDLFADFLGED